MTPGCGMGTSKAAGTMQTAGKVVRYCKCVWPNRRWLKVDSPYATEFYRKAKGGESSQKRKWAKAQQRRRRWQQQQNKIKTYKEFSID